MATFDFSGKVVFVTGAAGNLGQAVARAFHAAGAHLALADRSAERLAASFPDLAGSAEHLLLTPLDLNDPAAVRQAVGSIVERFGRMDALANLAGGYRAGKPLHEEPVETFDFLVALNARIPWILSQAVIPVMLAQKSGKIIHISARAGLSGSANSAAYSASKSALIRLVESMAAELKNEGINVNCLLPSIIDTPENRQAMPKTDPNRWVSPDSLAEVVLFLASEAARDIHGAALPVYGRS